MLYKFDVRIVPFALNPQQKIHYLVIYASRAPVFSREKEFGGTVSLVQKLCLPFSPLSPACILVQKLFLPFLSGRGILQSVGRAGNQLFRPTAFV
jgi:hypothetical protein